MKIIIIPFDDSERCRRAVKICGRMFVRASKLLDFHLGNTTTDYRKQHCVLREVCVCVCVAHVVDVVSSIDKLNYAN